MQKSFALRLLIILFFSLHACCLLVLLPPIWQATSAGMLLLALGTFVIRKLALTGGYHRYFSHRTFKTSRAFQFIMAWVGASAAQKGL